MVRCGSDLAAATVAVMAVVSSMMMRVVVDAAIGWAAEGTAVGWAAGSAPVAEARLEVTVVEPDGEGSTSVEP